MWRVLLCTNNYRAVILLHPKPGIEGLIESAVECVKVTQGPRGDAVEGQDATWPVQIDSDPVGTRQRCWYLHRLVVMLSSVVILRAVQTPGLVCVAKPTEVRARPSTNPPHCHGDIHPASSPLHLPVVALGEVLVTEHLGNTLKPLRMIWVLLSLSDPCHLLSPVVQEERLGSCVHVKRQCTCICTRHRYGFFSVLFEWLFN